MSACALSFCASALPMDVSVLRSRVPVLSMGMAAHRWAGTAIPWAEP